MGKKKLPYILSKEHIVKLFEAMYVPKVAIACFVSLMCGLRIEEVRKLQIIDIDLKARRILIRNSKNPNRSREGYGKDRVVPLPQCAISPIKKWLSIIEGHTKWFLPSSKSTEIPISQECLHSNFAEARQRAGLSSVEYEIEYKKNAKSFARGRKQYNIKWHSLRHFYATYVYEKTRDLYAVSDLLGHNQVSTTQIYAKVSDKNKKETVDFAFNVPIKPLLFEKILQNQEGKLIPGIEMNEQTPLQILEERFARGEISASDFQTSLRLLKIKKDFFEKEEEEVMSTQEQKEN